MCVTALEIQALCVGFCLECLHTGGRSDRESLLCLLSMSKSALPLCCMLSCRCSFSRAVTGFGRDPEADAKVLSPKVTVGPGGRGVKVFPVQGRALVFW